jgi:hypothetical protein
MADYIFKVYLHTDRANFNVAYSLSDYTFYLPSFYFTRNEFVSPKADINILNSILDCSGANVYHGAVTLGGASREYTPVDKRNIYNILGVSSSAFSDAIAIGNPIAYSYISCAPYTYTSASAVII